MANIVSALSSLIKNTPWSFEGKADEVDSEAKLFAGLRVGKGTNPDGSTAFSNNPADFPVTWAQVSAEKARLQELEDATAHQALRRFEYPSIGDQLDALYHAGVFPEDMAAKIKAVKDKYPKS